MNDFSKYYDDYLVDRMFDDNYAIIKSPYTGELPYAHKIYIRGKCYDPFIQINFDELSGQFTLTFRHNDDIDNGTYDRCRSYFIDRITKYNNALLSGELIYQEDKSFTNIYEYN